jgi:hypothetical protein
MPESNGRLIKPADFAQLLSAFGPHLVCWKVGLFCGSMVYFEMGARQKKRLRTGDEIERGDAHLVLDGYNWAIRDGAWTLATSPTVTRELAETVLAERFIGQRLVEVEFSEQFLSGSKQVRVAIVFADAPTIEIWAVPEEKEYVDDELFSLRLPNGQWVVGGADCRLMVSDGEARN